MLKDPNQGTETPYDLLKLPPKATCADVHKALPRFMRDRRNIARIGQAQDAVRKLQNPKARAAIDIWFYHIHSPKSDPDPHDLATPFLAELSRIPVYEPQRLYCDLEGADLAADFREIKVRRVQFSDIRSFDGMEDVRLRPRFD
jgi:hypothetical protein